MGEFKTPSGPPFSVQGSRFTFGVLKDIVSEVVTGEDVVGLHGGLPPPECFPISTISLTLADGQRVDVPASIAQQQYNISPTGYPKLREWCQTHTRRMHGSLSQHEVVITSGSTHSLDLLTSILLDPGDTLLVEAYTYPHFLDCIANVKGYNVVPVAIDPDGILPADLEAAILTAHPKPKVLYTVPFGQNPTGCNTLFDRKRIIYEICRGHAVYIIEDDPYAYLQFPLDPAQAMPGVDSLVINSYLSLDEDGEFVCRLDSFAKSVAPGFRLGWATASRRVAERLAMGLQGQTIGANVVSQVILAEILDAWGDRGLQRHLEKVQRVYAERAAALIAAATVELTGLARWQAPTAGMFLVRRQRYSDIKPLFIISYIKKYLI